MVNILIVEDYQNLRKIYEEEFKAKGFKVKLAADGEEGIHLALVNDFDIILLDLMMPQSDGFDFLKGYVSKQPPRAKIIIFSNMYSPELVNKALQLGASQYLLKADITPKQIFEIVQQTLAEDKKP